MMKSTKIRAADVITVTHTFTRRRLFAADVGLEEGDETEVDTAASLGDIFFDN
jgi:hypothetical protein